MNVWLIVWIAAMIVLLIVEAITMGLTTIWFAGGALVAAILAACNAPLLVQILAFIIVSFVLLYFTRPLVKDSFNKSRTLTNAESLVGKKAYVKEQIDNVNATGMVKLDGMEWTARTAKDGVIIPVEALVEVKEIDGVKVIVEQIKEGNI